MRLRSRGLGQHKRGNAVSIQTAVHSADSRRCLLSWHRCPRFLLRSRKPSCRVLRLLTNSLQDATPIVNYLRLTERFMLDIFASHWLHLTVSIGHEPFQRDTREWKTA